MENRRIDGGVNYYMWVIFLVTVFALGAVGLALVWIGNKIYISIRRQNKKFELEEQAFNSTKKAIEDEIEETRKNIKNQID